MLQKILFLAFLFPFIAVAQKKPLDHSVYDSWKSIGERMITNDGAYVVYTVNPQEGDGELVIQNPSAQYKKIIPRGYNAVITEDSKYLLFKIKPYFQETRQAKIKKKKADDMPKDTLGIVELGQDSVIKIARIKNYKTPEKGFGYAAYQFEKALPDTAKKKKNTDTVPYQYAGLLQLADSLLKVSIDSVKGNVSREELTRIMNKAAAQILKEGKDVEDADVEDAGGNNNQEGTDLVLRNLVTGADTLFRLVNEFYFDKNGTKLLLEISQNKKDSNSKSMVLLYDLLNRSTDTVMKGFNDARGYALDDNGKQLAFTAERDSSEKALTRFYKLWYYSGVEDTAILIADKNTAGLQLGYTVSENAVNRFSKNGKQLFFGTTPVRSPKDTTLVDFETAKLDIWHYKDDYLQPQQLKNLDAELKRSFTAVYHTGNGKVMQLGAEDAENISLADEGNADWVLAESNKGNRVQSQWNGRTRNTAYSINTVTGTRKTIFKNLYANAEPSPGGKYVYWYNAELKNYFTYEITTGITRNVTAGIRQPLYDTDHDVPDFAAAYGLMGWTEGDTAMFVYDEYDVWKLMPDKTDSGFSRISTLPGGRDAKPVPGRLNKLATRFVITDKEHRFFSLGKKYLFTLFNRETRETGLFIAPINELAHPAFVVYDGKAATGRYLLSKNNQSFVFSKENYRESPNLFYVSLDSMARRATYGANGEIMNYLYLSNEQLSNINPQQDEYNWGTAELFKWKAYNGKQTQGIVYKPEDYDPKKKYPLICYFYEKLTDGLYTYQPPAPTPSRLNIPFFVSRGYIVLAPDISYTVGHPGNSAYDYVASGARALVKAGMVDSTRIGIQGQSWGGYQVAYLITRTKLFKAAWAGAPVANMTSAYGGIRWESGLNRQFQYEKQQSRIGATLWEKPQLYIENSPLFHLHKVQTPLVIMHNDADGAVPWYQGIELFTSLRRLGKPVWMLNYNNDAHNLMERRNRKDIQIREQQFFDWQLKGEKAPKWLTEGVPATEKGKEWGLQVD